MPSLYEVKLFREEGFKRVKCKSCGRYFWTLGDKKICGEPPCQEYDFIGNSPMKNKLSLHEMRETFLTFFEKKNHKRISRYPVVARWRDDIFFSIASISCFQPWVLNRTINPPANPLVMSQPSLRFNDIDNVGKTGRHLTLFEMMAHHAFNTPDNWIYFTDYTTELCHEFLLSLGVPSEEVIYLESEWAGGGNSGPCFEVVVRGIELATLVFMMYEGEGKGRKEMEMQVVDTGYGLERFTWFSLGKENVYESIFGPVLKKLKEEVGVDINSEVLKEYSKKAGMLDSSTELKKMRKKIAQEINLSEKDQKQLIQLENIYAICDHTRALMFMLNDGLIPSNVKGGYFARLLARRTLRSLNYLNLDFSLKDFIDWQVDYFKRSFPELEKNKQNMKKILEVEEKKYEKTVKRGKKIILSLEKKLKEKNQEKIAVSELIKLYNTYGLTPELVKEFSNLKVFIPEDFYNQVAERYEKLKQEEKEKKIKLPENLPPTLLAFYEDEKKRKFKAKVVGKTNSGIILDKTYFYAEGGGQEGDRGRINHLEVINTKKQEKVIIHEVKGNLDEIKIGEEVEGEVNWERRKQLMQHHTSAHIINGAAKKVLGSHVWQAGAHKSEKLGRLDITHYARVTKEELEEIEKKANEVVKERREIEKKFMPRDKAERLFGFTIYQGGAVPGREIRIVNIKNWDVEACGGTHFDNTGEVGKIKLLRTKRIQDGVVRLEFKAGKAVKEYETKLDRLTSESGLEKINEKELKKISSLLSVPLEQLPSVVKKFRKEWREQKRDIEKLQKEISKLGGNLYSLDERYPQLPSGKPEESIKKLFEEWKDQKKDIQKMRKELSKLLEDKIKDKIFKGKVKEKEGVIIVKELLSNLEMENLLEISKNLLKEKKNLVVILGNVKERRANIVVRSNSKINAGELAKKISQKIGGGAHGDKHLGTGGGSSEGIEEIFEELNLII